MAEKKDCKRDSFMNNRSIIRLDRYSENIDIYRNIKEEKSVLEEGQQRAGIRHERHKTK